MKRIIILLLLLVSATAFSQERLIKIINDGGGPGPTNWKHMSVERITYDQQGRVKMLHDIHYDTTGVGIYSVNYRRYFYTNNGQVDSVASSVVDLQTLDTLFYSYVKYYYNNMLMDSLYGHSIWNGTVYERGANKTHYQNGLATQILIYSYEDGYGFYITDKRDLLYDVNGNCITEIHKWGFLDQDLNYSLNDTLYAKLDHYYSNVSRKDSTIESATEMNDVTDIVELTQRNKTFYKYSQTDSLVRTEKTNFSWTIPGQYQWQPPLVNNYAYDNDNFLDKWNMYNIADSLQGSINTCAKYYRSNNGRLDSIYGGNSIIAGGLDLDMTDYLGRTIYVYSTDEGEINSIPDLNATNITIYPNPFIQFITIDTDNTDKKQVLVFDMNGKVVANATTADRMYVYDARTLPAGMYMVSVSTPKGTVVKTLVKTQ